MRLLHSIQLWSNLFGKFLEIIYTYVIPATRKTTMPRILVHLQLGSNFPGANFPYLVMYPGLPILAARKFRGYQKICLNLNYDQFGHVDADLNLDSAVWTLGADSTWFADVMV